MMSVGHQHMPVFREHSPIKVQGATLKSKCNGLYTVKRDGSDKE